MVKYTGKELRLIWLDSFSGLEYKHKKAIYRLLDGKTDIKKLIESRENEISLQIGANGYKILHQAANEDYLKFVLSGLEKRGIVCLTAESEAYPVLLKQTSLPPLVLYAKGDVSILNGECFAVVGSRKSLPFQKSVATDFTSSLIDAGFIPVTGIAEGVDETVLKCALGKKAPAVSVLAGGLDSVYPSSNRNLADLVAENGVVISEYPPETAALPYHFPIRNRIIAGLSVGTLVVSAGKKSGTLYTAEYAEEYGRKVFAVPYGIGVASGVGCNDLIKRGAFLADDPKDILDMFDKKISDTPLSLNEDEKAVIAALSDGEKHIEKICEDLHKKIFEVTPVLSILEIKGVISKNGGNAYGLVRACRED